MSCVRARLGSAAPAAATSVRPHGPPGDHTAPASGRPFAGPDGDLDGAALESELLPQPALHEPDVAGVEHAGGEENEAGRAGPGLGREEDAGGAATAHRV